MPRKSPSAAVLPGHELLQAYLREHKQVELADILGVSQQTISSWAVGRIRPDASRRTLLAEILGIPMDAWLTDDERRRLRTHHLHSASVNTGKVAGKRRARSGGKEARS